MIMTLLASLSAGIAVTCFFLLVADLISRVEVDSDSYGEDSRKLPLIFRMFLPLAGNFSFLIEKNIFSSTRKNTEYMIQSAGIDQAVTASQFIAVRLLLLIVALLFYPFMVMGNQGLAALLIVFLAFMYPNVWLRKTVRLRHLSMLKSLPNLLDLLTLSVEAGKDFLTALRDILVRRNDDPLGNEMKRALHEIQLGKQRQQALRDLSNRVHLPELTSVINAIIQADELGVGIGQLLRIQGDQLRHKRFARAETLANEAPVKILFPVVVFIFPSVFIILVAPIISQALQTLSM